MSDIKVKSVAFRRHGARNCTPTLLTQHAMPCTILPRPRLIRSSYTCNDYWQNHQEVRRKQKVLSGWITIQLTELRELYKNRRNPYFTTSLALQIRELITCSLNDIRIHVNNYFHCPPRGNPPWRLSVTSLPRDKDAYSLSLSLPRPYPP